jgi:hypothetical protein
MPTLPKAFQALPWLYPQLYRANADSYRASLVPCGFHIVVTSSRVDVSTHNLLKHYGAHGRIQKNHPADKTSIMIQRIRVEVSLYIYCFNILTKEKPPLKIAREKALWIRSCELRHHRSFFTWCAHCAVQLIRHILRRKCRIFNIFIFFFFVEGIDIIKDYN